MEPANFQCGHCGNVMAVAADHLGQQVQCPHCQQVVIAPTPAPVVEEPRPVEMPATVLETSPPPPANPSGESIFNVPPISEQESIFSETTPVGEDLFGGDEPRVEMPPEPVAPQVALDDAAPLPSLAPDAEAPAPRAETALPPAGDLPPLNGASDPALVQEVLWPPASPPPSAETTSGLLASDLQAPLVRMAARRTWVMPLLVVPLISYSILITIAVGYLWLRLQNQTHPLEALPDQGDNQGASHGKKSGLLEKMPKPDQDLPARLRVALGQSIRLGDIEVTPTKVERRKIRFQQGETVDPTEQETLALDMHLRNVSDDVHFKPLDPYFDRRWQPNKPGMMPYTFVTLGDKRFYGGPLDWQARSRDAPHVFVVGQDHDQELGPGEELTTFVCTDPQDKATAALDKLKDKGPYLWRVQVRRGLVTVKDREVPATAVVGVEFHRADVR